MIFYEWKTKCGQISRDTKTKLAETARNMLQNYWNESSDGFHFLLSMVTTRHIFFIGMQETNGSNYYALENAKTAFIAEYVDVVEIEEPKPCDYIGVAEITLDEFMKHLKQAEQIYSVQKPDISVLKMDSEQPVIPEKLFDKSIECSGQKSIFIPEDEIKRIESTQKPADYEAERPVHYLVYGNDRRVINDISEELINELRFFDRISSNRYLEISKDDLSILEKHEYIIQNLNNLDGGTVIVKLDDGTTDEDFERLVNAVYSEPRKYKGRYTVIFNLCCTDCHRVNEIERICDYWPFVEISDDKLERSSAIKLLDQIADENDVVLLEKHYDEILQTGRINSRSELSNAFRKWYLNTYNIRSNFPSYETFVTDFFGRRKPDCESYDKLDSLIGLKEVKSLCKEIICFYQMERLRKEQYPSTKAVAMHMVFQGNPGTAKTTVARIVAGIFKEKGILSKGDLIEVGRADLVGKYVGYTAQNVHSYFEKAKGSVLFIDEAYALADKDDQGDYGIEAINTIVQDMENYREDVVVIFAGYKKEMKDFIRRNSGLSSRISFYVDFPDYSEDELFEILKKMAKENHYTLTEDVRAAFEKYISNTVISTGNGRLVRNVFERARVKQSSRICEMPVKQMTKELFVLSGQDFGG